VMTNVESAKAEKTAADLLNGPPKDLEQLREEAKVAPLPFPLMALAYKRRKFFAAAFDDEVRYELPSFPSLFIAALDVSRPSWRIGRRALLHHRLLGRTVRTREL